MNPYVIIGAFAGAILWTLAVYNYATGHEARKWEAANAIALVAAKDQAAKDQKVLDDNAHLAAEEFWNTHPKIVTQTETVVKYAIKHVKDTSGCPTADLVRVYNASITGDDPGPKGDGSAGTNTASMPVKNSP